MKLSSLILFALYGVAGAETITYDDHIQDLFGSHCSKCHNEDKKKGGLNLMTYTGLMAGGSSGASVVPGNAKDSLLYLTMTHEEEPTMPPKRDKLPKKDLDMVMNFIKQGVKETGSSKALIAKKETMLDLSSGAGETFSGPGAMPKVVHTKQVNLSKRGNSIISLAHSPRSPLVAIGGYEQVLLYNSDNGELMGVWPFKEGTIRDLQFNPNGKVLVASGGQDGASGKIVAWDITKTNRIMEVGKEFETLMAASLSSDLQFFASSAASSSFKIASVTNKEDTEVIKKHTNWLTSISYSPDGILLATGDRDGGLYVWESHSKQRLYSLTAHKSKISKLRWKHDSNLLLSAGEDGEIIIWNMMNGRKLKSWKAHNPGVLSVDISIKGQVATSGRDNLVKIWDANGKLQKTIKGFNDLPLSVKFNHDGSKLLTGDWLGNVKSWNVSDVKEHKSYASFYSSPIKAKPAPAVAKTAAPKPTPKKVVAKPAPKVAEKPKAPVPAKTNMPAKPAPKVVAKSKAPAPAKTNMPAKPAPKVAEKPKAPAPAKTNMPAKPVPKVVGKPKAPAPVKTNMPAKPATKVVTKSKAPAPAKTNMPAKPAPKVATKPKAPTPAKTKEKAVAKKETEKTKTKSPIKATPKPPTVPAKQTQPIQPKKAEGKKTSA
jgi:WD40 repeat protein